MDKLKTMKFSLIAILVIPLLMVSCKQKKTTGETNEIDSLIVALERIKPVANSIDFVLEDSIRKVVNKKSEEINELLKDSLSAYHSILISNYTRIGKKKDRIKNPEDESKKTDPSSYEGQEKKYLMKEIDYTINQLKNLKHDFQNDLFKTEEEFRNYFEIETESAKKIISFVNVEKAANENKIETFKMLHPKVVLFHDSLKQSK
jgi:hypothetical protein